MDNLQAELPLTKRSYGSKRHEHHRIIDSFNVLNICDRDKADIMEALNSDKWDWYTDCDGCTCVSETYWPNKFFPPCLRHDFDFQTSNNGMEANARLYRLHVAYGVPRLRAAVRWVGVTFGWFTWFKWRNKKGVSDVKDNGDTKQT